MQALINVFKIPELRNKVLFTLGLLVVYRIGFWIPMPGIDQAAMFSFFEKTSTEGSAAGRAASFVAIFSGGALHQSTIFGLGIMPYISASIIFQLVTAVSPRLKKLQEEGPTGRQKIQEWTRYATLLLCVFQAIGFLSFLSAQGFVQPTWRGSQLWWAMAITALTAGTIFLMWLGEQIDRYGIGNGVSMIIMAGILTGMPRAIELVVKNWNPGEPGKLDLLSVLLLAGGFVLVVAGSVILTVAQRRIPVQQAKHTRGRRVYGGQKSYLPLRVNHSGVMPVIFSSSLMIFPAVIFKSLSDSARANEMAGWWVSLTTWLGDNFSHGEFPFLVCELVLIYFFSYFWITVQFNPDDMSKQLRDHGSFIPGLRPGPRTAEYLETVMSRITFVGAAMLAVIALLPMVVNKSMNIDFAVTQFLGGTGLLIVVSVTLDFIQRIEANLLMRNYAGFLGGSDDGKGPRIRGPRA
ncbi:MAG: preprotein translocase subunit SecY [Phycisphaeraceae bacterium]|nr:preprotein translocase subunit SecY [Phycisphaeraceae bacterium]